MIGPVYQIPDFLDSFNGPRLPHEPSRIQKAGERVFRFVTGQAASSEMERDAARVAHDEWLDQRNDALANVWQARIDAGEGRFYDAYDAYEDSAWAAWARREDARAALMAQTPAVATVEYLPPPAQA